MIEHRVGTSRRSGAVHAAARLVARPLLRYMPMGFPTTVIAPYLDRGVARLPRLSHTVHRPILGRHWRGELVTPLDGPTSDGAILYLHGGAFLFCGLGTHRRIVERLAHRTGMSVLSVEYRQLPRHRLEDSISDAVDAYAWMVRNGFADHRIVIAGDSAGGFLSFAAALRIRDSRLGRPAGIVGISPLLDLDHTAKAAHRNARRDAYIPARRIKQLGHKVVGSAPELHHSPVNADLAGLPPVLLIAAESEVLRVDAEVMAHRLDEAGVPCSLQIWEGQVHAFPVLAHLTPESRAAVKEIAGFATDAVAAAAQGGRWGVGRGARRTARRSTGVA